MNSDLLSDVLDALDLQQATLERQMDYTRRVHFWVRSYGAAGFVAGAIAIIVLAVVLFASS